MLGLYEAGGLGWGGWVFYEPWGLQTLGLYEAGGLECEMLQIFV